MLKPSYLLSTYFDKWPQFSCASDADVLVNNAAGAEGEERATGSTDAGPCLRHCPSRGHQLALVKTEKEMLLSRQCSARIFSLWAESSGAGWH